MTKSLTNTIIRTTPFMLNQSYLVMAMTGHLAVATSSDSVTRLKSEHDDF